MSDRYFTLEDAGRVVDLRTQINPRQIQEALNQMTKAVYVNINWRSNDASVYTGITGVAFMFLRLHQMKVKLDWTVCLDAATAIVDEFWERANSARHTEKPAFLIGGSGYFAVAAAIYALNRNRPRFTICWSEILDHYGPIALQSETDNEVLYGSAGFLYTLRFLAANSGIVNLSDSRLVRIKELEVKIAAKIMNCFDENVFWPWHGKTYFGAAHGVIGILSNVLKSSDSFDRQVLELLNKILADCRYPNGNLKSSKDSRTDRLVQWCHGSVGLTLLLLDVLEKFELPEESRQILLNEIENSVKVIEERGLLRKGFGLCHGIAGNGIALLRASKALNMNDSEILKNFLLLSMNYGRLLKGELCSLSDHPYSLYEGLAGAVLFLAQFDKEKISFPGYDDY